LTLSTKDEMGKRPPVLLLDGGIVSLAAARSLGKQGIRVYALDIAQNHARYSRYTRRVRFQEDNQQAWLEWLSGEGSRKYRGSVLLPCSDNVIELAARHRSQLERDYILPEGKNEVLLAMLDKAETYRLAEKAGIPAPKMWIVTTIDEVESIRASLPYPCALKPRFSHDFRGRETAKKIFIVHNHSELLRDFKYIQTLGQRGNFRSDLIITELIPGEGEDLFQSYYSYLDESGTPLFHFTKRKLRQYPNDSGNGTYHKTDWNPRVAEMGLKFFKGVGYLGLGAIEFKLDPRDGVLKLMECNPRLTNATELLHRCGFDVALFVYNRLTGRPLPPVDGYRRGVYLIRPFRDFLSFLSARRRGLLTWRRWVKSVLHRQHFEAFAWDDPLPWAMIGYYYIKRSTKLRGRKTSP
jgi:D-aspartate ligase